MAASRRVAGEPGLGESTVFYSAGRSPVRQQWQAVDKVAVRNLEWTSHGDVQKIIAKAKTMRRSKALLEVLLRYKEGPRLVVCDANQMSGQPDNQTRR